MKENELRLNNLVMVNYKGVDLLSKVTWIQEGSINVVFDRQPDLVNGMICSVNDLIPIELTENLLLEYGFEKEKEEEVQFYQGYNKGNRLLCAKNADFEGMIKGGGSAVAYAWYVWEKGFSGKTTIEWIN